MWQGFIQFINTFVNNYNSLYIDFICPINGNLHIWMKYSKSPAVTISKSVYRRS